MEVSHSESDARWKGPICKSYSHSFPLSQEPMIGCPDLSGALYDRFELGCECMKYREMGNIPFESHIASGLDPIE